MRLPIRVVTAPPSFTPMEEGDAGHYCDLHPIDDWLVYAVAAILPDEVRTAIHQPGSTAYLVHGDRDREVGLLFCHADDGEGILCRGVGAAGAVTGEASVNEALWRTLNDAEDLPEGHRLARTGRASH